MSDGQVMPVLGPQPVGPLGIVDPRQHLVLWAPTISGAILEPMATPVP